MRFSLVLLQICVLIWTSCPQAQAWMKVSVGTDFYWESSDYSLAIDLDGNPRAVYSNIHDHRLEYISCDWYCWSRLSWTVVVVDRNIGYHDFRFASLKLDAAGNPRIAYYDERYQDLKYARCDADCSEAPSWEVISLDVEGDVGQFASLALDRSNNPRIAYFDATAGVPKYALCDGECGNPDNWTTIGLAAPGWGGAFTSLALTGSDHPRITCYNQQDGALAYLYCEGGCQDPSNWAELTIDGDGNVGTGTRLALDGSGNPRVAYYDIDRDTLKYAFCHTECQIQANWSKVDVETGVADWSLALDHSGNPRMSYYDSAPDRQDLIYTLCDAGCGDPANWIRTVALTQDRVGENSSLALDAWGEPRIVCTHDTPDDGGKLHYVLPCTDDDGDEFSPDGDCGGEDCNDDPTNDPPNCAGCLCKDWGCGMCARCMHPWAKEHVNDEVDSNCNGAEACFVATAAYGSSRQQEVNVLREFRDRILQKHGWGISLIEGYWDYGPTFARWIARHSVLRAAARIALLPAVGCAWLALALFSG